MTTYMEAANKSYKSLLLRWDNMSIVTGPKAPSPSFWITGNTLQSFINYWIFAEQPLDLEVLTPILNYFYTIVRPDINQGDLDAISKRALTEGRFWLDDFGWWGNAFATVCEIGEGSYLSGDDIQVFLNAAINCWKLMHAGWDIPASKEMPDGVWNTKKAADGPNDADLHGRNNVTNTQFWLLSYRLAQLTGDSQLYLNRWQDIRKWFDDLYSGGLLLDPDSLLVRERFKGATGEKWTDNFYWAGDQGLFLHCVNLDTRSTPPFSDLRTEVLQSVLSNMCDDANVLHDQRIVTTNGFDNDYATGKGVFFKHILPTAQSNPNQKLYDCIMTSAAHAWKSTTPMQPTYLLDFKYGWNDQGKLPRAGNWDTSDTATPSPFRTLILHVAGLDALITAAALNPNGIVPE